MRYVSLFNIVVVLFVCLNIIPYSSVIAQGPSQEDTYYLQVNLTTNPTIVIPGTNGYIGLSLENIGTGTISDINVSVSSQNTTVIQEHGNWDTEVGSLAGGDSSILLYEFEVSDSAEPGLYQINFQIDYSKGSNDNDTINQTAIIKIEDTTILDIANVTPNTLIIGESTTMVFNISNSGKNTIENVLFIWEDPNNMVLPVGADNQITIESIAPQSYAEVSTDVMASPSTTAGVYPITIILEFYDSTGIKKQVTSKVGIQISGTTDFDVVVDDVDGSSMTFSISNIGTCVASSVVVTIPNHTDYEVVGPNSETLGNIDAGDYTSTTFDIEYNASFKENEQKSIMINISYTDKFGARRVVSKEVAIWEDTGSDQVVPRRRAPALGQNSVYIIIGVLGIVATIVVLKYQKWRRSRLTFKTNEFEEELEDEEKDKEENEPNLQVKSELKKMKKGE